jgi:DNA-binding response OmpR family regulator
MTTRARICLIDDDVVLLDALAMSLREVGYYDATAPGAAAGLDLMMRDKMDVIVTDMNMPGTSGAQFIAEARAKWAELPIVAISGATVIDGISARDAARALGADALLAKPFRAHALGQVIEQLVAARR